MLCVRGGDEVFEVPKMSNDDLELAFYVSGIHGNLHRMQGALPGMVHIDIFQAQKRFGHRRLWSLKWMMKQGRRYSRGSFFASSRSKLLLLLY